MLHPDVGDQCGALFRTALSTGYEPNFVLPHSYPNFISAANGEDEDQMTVEHSQLGQAHLIQCVKIMFLRRHGETRKQFNEQPREEEYKEKFQLPPHVVPHDPQNFVHRVSDYWRNQRYNALQYQQRHFLVQEATAVMIWRGAHNAGTLSQLRRELQHYHLHAEDQTNEFQ